MNASQLARSAYAPTATAVRTDRGTEYQAFANVTARMNAAHQRGSAGFSELVAALHANRRLWTLLGSDVAGTENGLPAGLRAQLFYLTEFTQAHTSKVLAGDADADVLIEINRTVMRGLSEERAAA